ncbi:hypothetical protein SBOR_8237 [Sclerotinia borealis F-4128]|uniref:Capsule polysaccharide biosynthesis protein n=1 Tax=Sclerotinia borealis (strain F-4128) TaxID=1432307 RepID=W9CA20_SCLBF|nr:hypothetical protein SBOR_8237 [Sclerotinia borealis F-4128]
MASATRLPLKSILFTTAVVAAAGASHVNLQNLLVDTFTGPGSYSRIAATVVILANLKSLPGVWHIRVWNAILKHLIFTIPNIPSNLGPSSLFLPVITTSHAPLWECDYNLHKSNSTYFSDLDVTRSHIICCLLEPGIHALQQNLTKKLVLDKNGNAVKGRWGIMLGGVMCNFKREIGIYQSYEMWSRVLCWDRKWIYVVTHFVKKGTVRPRGFVLGDGSWFGGGNARFEEGEQGDAVEVDEKAVFASAVSKYVMKLGRLTVHPEVVLNASGVLPERPGGWHSMDDSGASTPDMDMEGSFVDAELEEEGKESSNEWDWKRIDRENKRGQQFAEHIAAMEGLHQEFSGSQAPALGKYRDLL